MIKLVQILAVASCACAYRVPVCMTESGARRVVPRRSMLAKTLAAVGALGVQPALADDWTVTDSGLKYLDTAKGEGDPPTPGQTVNVHYTGWLKGFGDEGAKFDSSYGSDLLGKEYDPFKFRVGKGKVISGWEGLALGMRPGSKLIARIPPAFAYGDKGVGPIPPGSTLVFYMECVKLGNIKGDKPRLSNLNGDR